MVRWIFESYLNGMGAYVIAKMLNDHQIPTIRESEKWQDSVVKNILTNPVYEGDALHQRTYTEKQFPLRTCPPQTGCTPVVPLGSLDAIFFTPDRRMQECHCAPVTAP